MSCGTVMQVAIGSYQLQEISLIGEAVNLAARLMEYSQFLAQTKRDELDHRFTVLLSESFIDNNGVKPFKVLEETWIRDFATLRDIARLEF